MVTISLFCSDSLSLSLRLFVCGHIHGAHAVLKGEGELEGVTVVNAAMCNEGYTHKWPVETLEI